jgi:hypothetical protein
VLPFDHPWDGEGTGSVCVVPAGDELRMYYTALKEYREVPPDVEATHDPLLVVGIGYAVSTDGVHWTKPFDTALVQPRWREHEPFEYIVSKPCVQRDGEVWRMWASSVSPAYRLRTLWSPDGLDWRWDPDGPTGILGLGAAGAFDDRMTSYASVVRHGATWRLWYTGNDFGATGMGYAEGV